MIVALTQALETQLEAYTSKAFTRAYIVSSKPSEVLSGKWFIMSAGQEVTKAGHSDSHVLEMYLVYQRALPNADSGKPLLNNTFLDACMAEVQTIINLFQNPDDVSSPDSHTGKFNSCGQYGTIGGFTFERYNANPLFDPVLLRDNHIFSSVVRVTYRG